MMLLLEHLGYRPTTSPYMSRLYGGALLDPLIGGGLETAPISLELFGAVELKPWSRDEHIVR